jgi:hypothetical protein
MLPFCHTDVCWLLLYFVDRTCSLGWRQGKLLLRLVLFLILVSTWCWCCVLRWPCRINTALLRLACAGLFC